MYYGSNQLFRASVFLCKWGALPTHFSNEVLKEVDVLQLMRVQTLVCIINWLSFVCTNLRLSWTCMHSTKKSPIILFICAETAEVDFVTLSFALLDICWSFYHWDLYCDCNTVWRLDQQECSALLKFVIPLHSHILSQWFTTFCGA